MARKKIKAKRRPKRKPSLKSRLEAKGMPIPQQIEIGSKDFAALQNKWYDKLKKSGFDDIEWLDAKTGLGQNSDYLKDPDQNKAKAYSKETETFYRLCTNYLTHNEIIGKKLAHIYTEFSEGKSYREILKSFNKRFHRKPVSLYYIFYHVNKFKTAVMHWNKEHKEGLLYPSATIVPEFNADAVRPARYYLL